MTQLVYHADREGREAGFVFYEGLVKPETKEGAGDAIVNSSMFVIEPGINFLSDDQIAVVKLYLGMDKRFKDKVFDVAVPPVEPVPPVDLTPKTPAASTKATPNP